MSDSTGYFIVALVAILIGMALGAFLAEQTKDCSEQYHMGMMAVLDCPGDFVAKDAQYTCNSKQIRSTCTVDLAPGDWDVVVNSNCDFRTTRKASLK